MGSGPAITDPSLNTDRQINSPQPDRLTPSSKISSSQGCRQSKGAMNVRKHCLGGEVDGRRGGGEDDGRRRKIVLNI